MDMFNKARSKVKAVVKDVQTSIQQPQVPWNQQQPQNQYQYPPQNQYQPQQYHSQQEYSTQPQYPPQQQYHHQQHFPPPQQYPPPQNHAPPPFQQAYQPQQAPYMAQAQHQGSYQYSPAPNQQTYQSLAPLPLQSIYAPPGGGQPAPIPQHVQGYSQPSAFAPSPSQFSSPPPAPQQIAYGSHASVQNSPAVQINQEHSLFSAALPSPAHVNQNAHSVANQDMSRIPDLAEQLASVKISAPSPQASIPQQTAQLPQTTVTWPSEFSVPTGQACSNMQATLKDYVQFYILTEAARTDKSGVVLIENAVNVCSACFNNHVARYPDLASFFKPMEKEPAVESEAVPNVSYLKYVCDFYMPRVLSTFYTICVPRNSISPLVEYGHLSTKLSFCGKTSIAEGLCYKTEALPELDVCETCFEYFICRTPFEQHFKKSRSSGNQRTCDLGYTEYIHRQLVTNLKSPLPNFDSFVSDARKYLALSPCPGEGQKFAATGQDEVWVFEATEGKSGNFCQKCFYDYAQGSSLETKFNGTSKLNEDQKADLPCDLSSEFAKLLFERAKRTGDDEIWRTALVTHFEAPACPSVKGIDENELQQLRTAHGVMAEWYCFKNSPKVEFCHYCYGTFVNVLGATHLVEPITRPLKSGVIRQCLLSASKYPNNDASSIFNFESPLHWRSQMLRNSMGYGWDSRGNWEILLYLANTIGQWAPTCGLNTRSFKPSSGRKWYGRFAPENTPDDVTIVLCEECRDNHVIEFHYFESYLDHDITAEVYRIAPPEGYMCHFFGRTTQKKIKQCAEGNDWAGFVQHMKNREETSARWHAWKALLDRQNELTAAHAAEINRQTEINIMQQSTKLYQQLNANTNAIIMGIGGSVAEAASPDTGYRYGNSNVGMGYLTAAGANAAQAHHDLGNRMPTAAMNPGPVHSGNVRSLGNTGSITEDLKYFLVQFDIVTKEWIAIQ